MYIVKSLFFLNCYNALSPASCSLIQVCLQVHKHRGKWSAHLPSSHCVFALEPSGYDSSSFLFSSNQADTALQTHTRTHTQMHTQLLEDGINHVCSRHIPWNHHFPPHLRLVVLSLRLYSQFPLGWASCRLRNRSRTPMPRWWSYLRQCPAKCRPYTS